MSVVLNPTDFSIEVTYSKDGLFDSFEFRIWEDGDDKEQAEILQAEGLGAGPYTIWVPRVFRTAVGTTWHCEVRVRNTDGQTSDWEGDTVVAVPTELSIMEADGVYVASDYVLRDGTSGLTDDWDVGPHQVRMAEVYADDAGGTSTLAGDVDVGGDLDVIGAITNAEWQGDVIDSAYIDQSLSVTSLTTTGTVQAEHLYSTDDIVADNDVNVGNQIYRATGVILDSANPGSAEAVTRVLLPGNGTQDRYLRFMHEKENGSRNFIIGFNVKYDGTDYTQGLWGGSSMIFFKNNGDLAFYGDTSDTGGSESVITPTRLWVMQTDGDLIPSAGGNVGSSGERVDTVYADDGDFANDVTASGTVQAEHLYSTDDIVADGNIEAESGTVKAGDIFLANSYIVKNADDGVLYISGGNATNDGGNIVLHGGGQSDAGDIQFREGGDILLRWDESDNRWETNENWYFSGTQVAMGTTVGGSYRLKLYRDATIGSIASHTLTNATLLITDSSYNGYFDANSWWTDGSLILGCSDSDDVIQLGIDTSTIMQVGASAINISQDFDPTSNYQVNLGSLTKKYLTLHAAELWVETLVAHDTMATIGGRVLVGPTTTLTSDLGSGVGDTTIEVEHNQMAVNDTCYLEANGKIEFMLVTAGPSGVGPYEYTVTRDRDGTGRNAWYAGDAVFNTGNDGDGWIDLYSVQGMDGSAAGPTIVGNVRNSTTYNDWSEHWAIGNLDGLYGYGATTYGVGLGEYSAATTYITIDSTDGYRVHAGGYVQAQWAVDGDLFFYDDGDDERILIGAFTPDAVARWGVRVADNSAGDSSVVYVSRIAPSTGGGGGFYYKADDTAPGGSDTYDVEAFRGDLTLVDTANDIIGMNLLVGDTGEAARSSDRYGYKATVEGNTSGEVYGVWASATNAGGGEAIAGKFTGDVRIYSGNLGASGEPVPVGYFTDLDVGDDLTVDGSVGIGVSPNDAYHLYVVDNTVTTDDSHYGALFDHTRTGGTTDQEDDLWGLYAAAAFDNSGATMGHLIGLQGNATLTDGTIGDGGGDLRAVAGIAKVVGGTVTDGAYGGWFLTNLDGGTIQDAVGIRVFIDIEGAATVTDDVIGAWIKIDDDAGAAGNVIMLYLDEDTGVDYGIYQDGGADNYFGGSIETPGTVQAEHLYSTDDAVVDGMFYMDGTSGDGKIVWRGAHGGGGEGLLYEDSGGGQRYFLNLPGSDVVALSNRAANGVVQVRANSATAGSGGEETVVEFQDTTAVFYKNVQIPDYFYHVGDTDTYLYYDTDYARLQAGGEAMLVLDDDGTSYIDVDTGQDFDIRVNGTAELTVEADTVTVTTDLTVGGSLAATTIAGITASDLVDKTAAETISGAWSFTDDVYVTSGDDAFEILGADSGTTNVLNALTVGHATSGMADDDFGVSIEFGLENSAGGQVTAAGRLELIWLDASSTTEDSEFAFHAYDDGVLTRVARINANGIFPNADSTFALGSSSLYWSAGYFDYIYTTASISVGGNLHADGSITADAGCCSDEYDDLGLIRNAIAATAWNVPEDKRPDILPELYETRAITNYVREGGNVPRINMGQFQYLLGGGLLQLEDRIISIERELKQAWGRVAQESARREKLKKENEELKGKLESFEERLTRLEKAA